jgi:hypothetical protein
VGVKSPAAIYAVDTPAAAASPVPKAAGRPGPGILDRRGEHPGGEAEQRQPRIAQETAAPEPDLREVFIAETLLEIRQLSVVQWRARLPPFDLVFFRGLYETHLFRRTVSGFYERDKVGGALVQEGLSGDRCALDLQGERRAF